VHGIVDEAAIGVHGIVEGKREGEGSNRRFDEKTLQIFEGADLGLAKQVCF
jgi:hypothetical protein